MNNCNRTTKTCVMHNNISTHKSILSIIARICSSCFYIFFVFYRINAIYSVIVTNDGNFSADEIDSVEPRPENKILHDKNTKALNHHPLHISPNAAKLSNPKSSCSITSQSVNIPENNTNRCIYAKIKSIYILHGTLHINSLGIDEYKCSGIENTDQMTLGHGQKGLENLYSTDTNYSAMESIVFQLMICKLYSFIIDMSVEDLDLYCHRQYIRKNTIKAFNVYVNNYFDNVCLQISKVRIDTAINTFLLRFRLGHKIQQIRNILKTLVDKSIFIEKSADGNTIKQNYPQLVNLLFELREVAIETLTDNYKKLHNFNGKIAKYNHVLTIINYFLTSYKILHNSLSNNYLMNNKTRLTETGTVSNSYPLYHLTNNMTTRYIFNNFFRDFNSTETKTKYYEKNAQCNNKFIPDVFIDSSMIEKLYDTKLNYFRDFFDTVLFRFHVDTEDNTCAYILKKVNLFLSYEVIRSDKCIVNIFHLLYYVYHFFNFANSLNISLRNKKKSIEVVNHFEMKQIDEVQSLLGIARCKFNRYLLHFSILFKNQINNIKDIEVLTSSIMNVLYDGEDIEDLDGIYMTAYEKDKNRLYEILNNNLGLVSFYMTNYDDKLTKIHKEINKKSSKKLDKNTIKLFKEKISKYHMNKLDQTIKLLKTYKVFISLLHLYIEDRIDKKNSVSPAESFIIQINNIMITNKNNIQALISNLMTVEEMRHKKIPKTIQYKLCFLFILHCHYYHQISATVSCFNEILDTINKKGNGKYKIIPTAENNLNIETKIVVEWYDGLAIMGVLHNKSGKNGNEEAINIPDFFLLKKKNVYNYNMKELCMILRHFLENHSKYEEIYTTEIYLTATYKTILHGLSVQVRHLNQILNPGKNNNYEGFDYANLNNTIDLSCNEIKYLADKKEYLDYRKEESTFFHGKCFCIALDRKYIDPDSKKYLEKSLEFLLSHIHTAYHRNYKEPFLIFELTVVFGNFMVNLCNHEKLISEIHYNQIAKNISNILTRFYNNYTYESCFRYASIDNTTPNPDIIDRYLNNACFDYFNQEKFQKFIHKCNVQSLKECENHNARYSFLVSSNSCYYINQYYHDALILNLYMYKNIIGITKKHLGQKNRILCGSGTKYTFCTDAINKDLDNLFIQSTLIESRNKFIRERIYEDFYETMKAQNPKIYLHNKLLDEDAYIHKDWNIIRETIHQKLEFSLWIIYYRFEESSVKKNNNILEIMGDLEDILLNYKKNIPYNDIGRIIIFILVKSTEFMSLSQEKKNEKNQRSILIEFEDKSLDMFYNENLDNFSNRLIAYREKLMILNADELTFEIVLECCQSIKNIVEIYQEHLRYIDNL